MPFETTGTKPAVVARAVFAVYGLCLIACGGGSPTAGSSGATTDHDAAAAPATFTRAYAEILEPYCSTCHRPGQLAPFMDFSSQSAAYDALVGVKASGPSCGSSGETRVVPGDASGSLLFQKISEAKPACGAPMPYGSPPLASAKVTLIEDWINAGASND
jgi:hypothetical protein